MFDRLKHPRRGKGAGKGGGLADRSESAAGLESGREAAGSGPDNPEQMRAAEAERPTFGRRGVPVAKDASAEPSKPKSKKKQNKNEDYTSEPVEDTPATTWRKAQTPPAPGEEVKLTRVFKPAPKPKVEPVIEKPPDESKLTFKREKRFYFAGDAEAETAAEKKARIEKEEAEAAKQAIEEADNVTPLNRRTLTPEQQAARAEAIRIEAEKREAARLEAEQLEEAAREAARIETERLEAARAEAARREAARQEAERLEALNREEAERET